MKKSLFTWLFALTAVLGATLAPKVSRASHAAGGELLYRWISGNTYQFLFKFYRDCEGINEPSSFTMCYSNTCNTFNSTITLNKTTTLIPEFGGDNTANGSVVGVGCPCTWTTCMSAPPPAPCPPPLPGTEALPSYREWWYTATLTLPPPACDFWIFGVNESARNGNVSNLQGGNLYVEATLNNADGVINGIGNSSAYFTNKPVPYVNTGIPYTYTMGAFDPNGDSIVYQVIQPRSGSDCSNPQNLPFSDTKYNLYDNPIDAGGSFVFDPATGQMTFQTISTHVANLAVLVKEYKNGILRGTVMRDIQIISVPGNSVQPTIEPLQSTVIGAQFDSGRVLGCAGEPISFCFEVESTDTGAVLVLSDNSATVTPGAIMAYSNMYTDSVRGCFSWTPGPADTGLHQLIVIVKDSNCRPPGILITQSYAIPVYVSPTTQIERDTTICQGDSVRLIATGGNSFTWTVLPNGSPLSSLSCTNCPNPVAKPTITTSYVVTSDLETVCNKNSDTVTITVPQTPVFDLGPDTTTCLNSSVQLNVNLVPNPLTLYTIQWTPATGLSSDTSATPFANPRDTATRYIVTITPNGQPACAVSDTITVRTLQGFAITNIDTAICLGNSIDVQGSGDPRYTYSWTPRSPVISNGTIITPTITPAAVGPVVYTLTASYGGCPDSVQSFIIDAQPNPVVNLGPDRALCQGDTAHLTPAISPAYPGYRYEWTPGGLLSATNIANPIFSADQTTELTLRVSTSAGCEASDSVVMTVTPADFIRLTGDTMLCPGDSVRLTFTGTDVAGFVWRPGLWMDDTTSATPVVHPVTSMRYTAYAIDSTGCRDTASVYVEMKPAAVVSLPDTVLLYPGDSIQFNPQDNGGNALRFTWDPPTGLNNAFIANPVATPGWSTLYTVTGITEFGCVDSAQVFVKVMNESLLGMPNAFAPSNAQANTYKVARNGIAKLKSFRIFNRWGTQVFQSTDIDAGWDGKLNGEPQPMGVYVYMIEATLPSGKTYYQQGSFTLIR